MDIEAMATGLYAIIAFLFGSVTLLTPILGFALFLYGLVILIMGKHVYYVGDGDVTRYKLVVKGKVARLFGILTMMPTITYYILFKTVPPYPLSLGLSLAGIPLAGILYPCHGLITLWWFVSGIHAYVRRAPSYEKESLRLPGE